VLAAPMAVIVIVLVQMFYVQGLLTYPVRVPGEHGAALTPAEAQRHER